MAATVVAVLLLAMSVSSSHAARRPSKPPAPSASFVDHFETWDAARWSKADGWKNGSPFDNGWRADHVEIAGGLLDLRLDDVASLGEPYTSGELRSNGYYGYGCYEASFKPIMVPGVVTSLFTFAGPSDNGGNGLHNEIDVEFLGNRPGWVQFNFWTNDDAYASRNEVLLNLGFDPTLAFHRYGFRWTADRIEWYVDGNRVYTAFDDPANPTPKASESLQKIMVNAWPVDATAELWAGRFAYDGTPLHAQYEWIRHIEGADCDLTAAPTAPPPPTGEPGTVQVRAIDLRLNAQGTQVIATVAVSDGFGDPVDAATVRGAWSGVISSGDGSRTTGADGTATFYSSRSRNPGSVTFCVTDVSRDGSSYASSANVETCDTLVK